ncbi:hypothetical protein B4P00_22070 [Shewanella xiamenensis]|jgi:hypothetical protein|uniref:hypothetical protein n=1 Tax=Shewanella xiamenensis TaxID=332186 RepID=UPI00084975FA|nr:hypothetical protein [Shewanella xiamenensis]MBW0298855.1 hypothetical protein [Shewanella xiamenensis]ODR83796.1 hypothetical protein ABT47_23865 [Shewanella xiamenensis]
MNLIPFGLRSDGVYIDVEIATRGKSCDCVCPSCGIALLGRLGEVNAPHFAHDCKEGSKEEIEACKFSFYVSVRYMLKQLFKEQCLLMLPPLDVDLGGENHVITKNTRITYELKDLTQDTYINDVKFDMVIAVSERKLCLYISHPGRPAPIYDDLRKDKQTAVLELELIHFAKVFSESHRLKSAKQLLLDWVESSIKGKHWIYNPRRSEWLEYQRTKEKPAESPKSTFDRIKEQIAKTETCKYHCVFCKLDFEGSSLLNRCPKCNDYLCVIRKHLNSVTSTAVKGKYRYR